MKIIGVKADILFSEKYDENEEKAYSNGIMNVCACCGKGIKNTENAKQIHVIEGWGAYTEDERDFGNGDMGWVFIGNSCYKKFLKNRKEIEVEEQ